MHIDTGKVQEQCSRTSYLGDTLNEDGGVKMFSHFVHESLSGGGRPFRREYPVRNVACVAERCMMCGCDE